jgi:diguanylate cyclase (GGDEF)-like protein/PAS domain S-box-containing protein
MKDESKTKQVLIREPASLRQKISEFEQTETDRKQAEEALRESEDRYRALVENASDIVFTTDATGHFTFVNPAALRITGYEEKEIIGRHYPTLIRPDMQEKALKFFDRQFVKRIHNTYFEYPVIVKDGREIWIGQNTQLIFQNNKVVAFQAVARDITERKKMEDKLKDSERRLRLITNNMMDLITVLDLNGNFVYISLSHNRVLGYESEELIKKWGIDLIHPDDREKILTTIRETLTEKKHQVVEGRLLHADGHYVWLEMVVDQLLDEEQKLAGVVFSSRDITERKKTEKALLNSEEKYRQILENIEDGYFEVDLAGHFTFFNDVLPRFLRYTREELSNENFKMVMDEQTVKKVFEIFHGVYLTGVSAQLVDFEIKRKDGSKAYVESSVSLIRDTEGEPIGFRGVVRDITKRKQLQDMLHTIAITDQLTGLYNRRGFITLAEQQLKYADRTKRKVLLSFIDLDGMKHINDVWGHEAGDKALVDTAKLLKQAFRESDIIARIGGDEFAVLTSDVIDSMQGVFINRLDRQIDIHNARKDLMYMLTLSIGSTFYEPDNPCSLDALMSKADKLMYEDKQRKAV